MQWNDMQSRDSCVRNVWRCVADNEWESFNSRQNFIPQRGVGHEVRQLHCTHTHTLMLVVLLIYIQYLSIIGCRQTSSDLILLTWPN